MDIQARKLRFIEQFLHVSNISIIKKLEGLLRKEFPSTIKLTIEEKEAARKGLESIRKGDVVSHNEVMSKAKKKIS